MMKNTSEYTEFVAEGHRDFSTETMWIPIIAKPTPDHNLGDPGSAG